MSDPMRRLAEMSLKSCRGYCRALEGGNDALRRELVRQRDALKKIAEGYCLGCSCGCNCDCPASLARGAISEMPVGAIFYSDNPEVLVHGPDEPTKVELNGQPVRYIWVRPEPEQKKPMRRGTKPEVRECEACCGTGRDNRMTMSICIKCKGTGNV